MADYAANPEINIAAGCSPLGGIINDEASAQLDEVINAMGPDERPAWLVLLQPAQATAAGIDLSGGIVVAAAKQGDDTSVHGELAFQGDAAAAEALLRSFTTNIEPQGTGWKIGAGDEPVLATLEGNRLTFQAGEASVARGEGDMPRVLDGLAEDAACTIFIRTTGRQKIPAGELAVWSQFAQAGKSRVLMRADMPERPAPRMLSKHHAPLNGSSTEAPLMIVTVGVPLLDLVDLIPDTPATASAKAEASKAKVKVKAGTTLALVGSKEDPSPMAAMRVGGRLGLPHTGRRVSHALEKTLEDTGATYERIDARTIRVDLAMGPLNGKPLFIGARFGKVYLAASEEALNTLIDGSGMPWLDEDQAAFAGDWALAVQADVPETGKVRLGFGADDAVWMAEIQGEATGNTSDLLGGSRVASLLTEAGNRLDHAFEGVASIEPDTGDRAGEAVEITRGLCVAEQAYEAAFDSYLTADFHPRPPAELNATAVAWDPAPQVFRTLGFAPPTSLVQGSYWIEGEPNGPVTVFGVTDMDGDGVHATVSASTAESCTVNLHDPPGVR